MSFFSQRDGVSDFGEFPNFGWSRKTSWHVALNEMHEQTSVMMPLFGPRESCRKRGTWGGAERLGALSLARNDSCANLLLPDSLRSPSCAAKQRAASNSKKGGGNHDRDQYRNRPTVCLQPDQ